MTEWSLWCSAGVGSCVLSACIRIFHLTTSHCYIYIWRCNSDVLWSSAGYRLHFKWAGRTENGTVSSININVVFTWNKVLTTRVGIKGQRLLPSGACCVWGQVVLQQTLRKLLNSQTGRQHLSSSMKSFITMSWFKNLWWQHGKLVQAAKFILLLACPTKIIGFQKLLQVLRTTR